VRVWECLGLTYGLRPWALYRVRAYLLSSSRRVRACGRWGARTIPRGAHLQGFPDRSTNENIQVGAERGAHPNQGSKNQCRVQCHAYYCQGYNCCFQRYVGDRHSHCCKLGGAQREGCQEGDEGRERKE